MASADELALLRTIVGAAPDAVYAKDASGRFIFVNRAAADFLGHAEDELLGCTAEELFGPEAGQEIEETDRRVLTGGPPVEVEETVVADGVERVFLTTKSPFLNASGEVVGVVGVSRDITESKQADRAVEVVRRELEQRSTERTAALAHANAAYEKQLAERQQAEEALRFSHTLLNAVVENTTDAVFVKDPAGRYLMINPAGAAMTGHTVDEVIGKDDTAVFEPEVADRIRRRDRDILASGEPETYESVGLSGGVTRYFSTTKAAYRDQKGNVLGLIGISRDITASRAAQEALAASEARYRSLFDVNPLPTLIFDAQTYQLLDVNDAAVRTYGYSRAEFLGMTVQDLRPYSDRLRGDQMDRRATPRDENATWRHRKKDGSVVNVEIKWRPLQFEGRPAKMIIAYDVTDRLRAEEQLQAMTAELQRSNRALMDFASVASHDLQEPLRKIQTFADRLRARYADGLPPEGMDYLERMQNAAGRMQTLINDLLAFSRLTTRAQPFTLTNLEEIAHGVESDLEDLVLRTGGTVRIDTLPSVYADALQMRQLFQNLIGNALKFHREGVAPEVRVTAALQMGEGSPSWRITVEDNGIGFEERYAERIFGFFERLHGREEYEGTGIGLAICRAIVRRHGGEIEASSVVGEGSRFAVTLPVRQRNPALAEGAA
jgi:PAS domain S-box-containing protein